MLKWFRILSLTMIEKVLKPFHSQLFVDKYKIYLISYLYVVLLKVIIDNTLLLRTEKHKD